MCTLISNMHVRILLCTTPSSQMLLSAGITYVRRNDLPQGTILFDSQTLNVVDSTFEQLAAFGQASLILTNSNVFFSNVTMNGNYQSQAGAILVNQTSNATIINSVFNNNFGYQAGAISVACEPFCPLSSCVPFMALGSPTWPLSRSSPRSVSTFVAARVVLQELLVVPSRGFELGS